MRYRGLNSENSSTLFLPFLCSASKRSRIVRTPLRNGPGILGLVTVNVLIMLRSCSVVSGRRAVESPARSRRTSSVSDSSSATDPGQSRSLMDSANSSPKSYSPIGASKHIMATYSGNLAAKAHTTAPPMDAPMINMGSVNWSLSKN